ncbi:MAG: type I-C CRISPR-associated protein Cas8c/Csd1 [Pirellulaceae bacterium]|nr:type I-C CRISPR-associated protein Cas8c/Csd1 [Pirellulaceae bacterium]
MLHALLEYARREKLATEPGFKSKAVRWLLQFTPDGKWLAPVIDLTGGEKKSKGREFQRCPDLTQPEMISSGSRHFLVDSLDKIVLLTKEEATEKEIASHNSFVSLLEKASSVLTELAPIAVTLNNQESLAAIQANLSELKAKPTDSATIAIVQGHKPHIFVDSDKWHEWWREFRGAISSGKESGSKKKESKQMRCFLSGELVEPALTQNKISGLSDVGGLPMGDVISSFDKEAFGHFDFKQGENAAISEEMVKTFTDALNHLIRRRAIRMAETKIVYWYSREIPDDEDVVRDLFAGTGLEDDGDEAGKKSGKAEPSNRQILQAESTARKLLEAIRTGHRDDLKDCQFFALTLSGNSGRVVIRDWMQGSFEQLAESIDSWFSDLSLMNISARLQVRNPSLMRLLTCVLKEKKPGQNFQNWIAPVLTARSGVWNAALKGERNCIPRSLVEKACIRQVAAAATGELPGGVRGDSENDNSADVPLRMSAWYARLSVMKLFCIRSKPLFSKEKKMLPNLDVNHERSSYHVGRLMAVLQMIQREAQGELGTTIAQSHYASAATRPIVALPRLETLTQHHLPNIGKKNAELRDQYVFLLTEIKGQIKGKIDRTYDLEDQCYFHLGYYHQLAFQPRTEPPLRHTTLKGANEKVRSMSELVIANWLFSNGVEYEYEKELKLSNGRLIRPDFTVEKSPLKKTVFIEHLGMMDNFTYRHNWKEKLESYREASIRELSEGGGENGILIVSQPSGTAFDCQEIQKLLAPLLTTK